MAEQDRLDAEALIGMTADLVAAYVGNNSLPVAELPALIGQVYAALQKTATGKTEPEPEVLTPAVPVKKSVTPDYIVCLEDGKKFKSLKRHLRTAYGLTPDEYRRKWNLPQDYPMVAPNYAAARSDLAKKSGLGQRRTAAKAVAAPAPARKGGRAKKAATA